MSDVFDFHIHRYMVKFNLACWGIPLIFPIIGLIWGKSDFANPRTCFLRKKYGLVTFYSPIILGILFNMFKFSRIFWSLFHGDIALEFDRNLSQLDKRKRQLKTAIKLMTLLGVSWIFGFFLIINEVNTVWLRWLFIIFNSTQGTFIFILYSLLNEDLRKVWRNKLSPSGSAAAPGYRTPGARARRPGSIQVTQAIEMEPLRLENASRPSRMDDVMAVSDCEESSSTLSTQTLPAQPPIVNSELLFENWSEGAQMYDNIGAVIPDNSLNLKRNYPARAKQRKLILERLTKDR